MSKSYVPLTVHSISESMRRRNPALFGPQNNAQKPRQAKPDPTPGPTPKTQQKQNKPQKTKGPNATEQRYYQEQILPRLRTGEMETAIFEGVSFLVAGHKYTPDWVCKTSDGKTIIIECKGAYKLQSYQRSKLAFDVVRQVWESKNMLFVWNEE